MTLPTLQSPGRHPQPLKLRRPRRCYSRQRRMPSVILIVAGVAGSGKTTVGALLAGRLGWRFADADAFHTAANIAKMAAGIPLTDADRQPWLRAIAAWM